MLARQSRLQGDDRLRIADVAGEPMMDVDKLVRQAIKGLQKDQLEILPGVSKVMRLMSRIAPGLMVKALSGSVDAMLAETKQLPAAD